MDELSKCKYLRELLSETDDDGTKMLLHNILKQYTLVDVLKIVDSAAAVSPMLVMQSRHKQWCRDGVDITFEEVPQYIVDHSDYQSYEVIANGKNPRLALGLPIWVFKR